MLIAHGNNIVMTHLYHRLARLNLHSRTGSSLQRRSRKEKQMEANNMMAMRDAIEKVVEILDREWDAHRETSAMWKIRDICTAALATPPRNCDKYPTHRVALDVWRDADPRENPCFDEWLYKAAKKGEAAK